MENVIDYISALGFILFLIGVFNRSKTWGQKLLIIGGFCMAAPVLYDAIRGFYDGIMGKPKN